MHYTHNIDSRGIWPQILLSLSTLKNQQYRCVYIFFKWSTGMCLLINDTLFEWRIMCPVIILTSFCCLLLSLNPCSKLWTMPARFKRTNEKTRSMPFCVLSLNNNRGQILYLKHYFININNPPLHSGGLWHQARYFGQKYGRADVEALAGPTPVQCYTDNTTSLSTDVLMLYFIY